MHRSSRSPSYEIISIVGLSAIKNKNLMIGAFYATRNISCSIEIIFLGACSCISFIVYWVNSKELESTGMVIRLFDKCSQSHMSCSRDR